MILIFIFQPKYEACRMQRIAHYIYTLHFCWFKSQSKFGKWLGDSMCIPLDILKYHFHIDAVIVKKYSSHPKNLRFYKCMKRNFIWQKYLNVRMSLSSVLFSCIRKILHISLLCVQKYNSLWMVTLKVKEIDLRNTTLQEGVKYLCHDSEQSVLHHTHHIKYREKMFEF